MKSSLTFLLLLFSILAFGQVKIEQTTTKPQPRIAPTARLTFLNGGQLLVKVLSKDSTHIHVLTVGKDQLLDIPIADLLNIAVVDASTATLKNYTFSTTRNSISTTAMGLKKGENFYQNTLLGYNSIYHGITNRWSIGGGTALFSLFEESTLPLWAHIKYSYSFSDIVHLSANFIPLKPFFLDDISDNDFVMIAWANATVGDRDNNLTIGWGRFGNEFDGQFSTNMTQISGQIRLSPKWRLTADYWLFDPRREQSPLSSFLPPDDRSRFLMLSFRYQKRQSQWEFGLMHIPDRGDFSFGEDVYLPMLTYTYRW
jgi:hypothetical protein